MQQFLRNWSNPREDRRSFPATVTLAFQPTARGACASWPGTASWRRQAAGHEALREWRAVRRNEVPSWRDAAFVAQSAAWLTAEELAALAEKLEEILLRYLPRLSDPAKRPPGSRPVRLVAWGIPATTDSEPVPSDHPAG